LIQPPGHLADKRGKHILLSQKQKKQKYKIQDKKMILQENRFICQWK